jgi:mannose-1-phosphate guanylyltransferase
MVTKNMSYCKEIIMSPVQKTTISRKLDIKDFGEDILKDYESCLGSFFDPESGAVLESERDDGTPKFLFTEVTGYAILDFIFLHSITGNDEYLERAKKSADWIKKEAIDPCGGVKTRYYFEKDSETGLIETSFYGRRIYSFDTAVCLKSLIALYDVTKDESYLELSKKMGDFLVTKMIDSSGKVFPIYNANDDKCVEEDRQVWSKRFGAFHTQIAAALVDLYDVTQEKKHLDMAERICWRVLRFQKSEGNFETSVGLTELHAHCYAAEGLLYVGRKIQNNTFIKAARDATEWALGKSQHGEIAQNFDVHTGAPLTQFRTDALAQTLTLAADLSRGGQLDGKYVNKMDELALKILDMKSANKYFRYGYYEKEFRGKLESNTRSYWTNMFCLHSLYKYYLAQILAHTWLVILAGGKGARCWPIACETMPKPLSVTLINNRSLLQETIRRYTHNGLIQPEQILILCSEKAKKKAEEQLKENGIPSKNILVEQEPKGTIPAVSVVFKEIKQRIDTEDIFIVSMADDLIEPVDQFQNALIPALFAARENDCLISIGKPVGKNQYDKRFGHMVYSSKVNSYRCFQVDMFIEKPTQSEFEDLKHFPGDMAWECGTIVFKESYFRQVVPTLEGENDLAKHLLSQASKWSSKGQNTLHMAVSILDVETSFEDFGVPGLNLYNFFRDHVRGHEKHDFGSGNICLGYTSSIEMKSCANNLVIANKLPIKIFGLEDYLIIDNGWTNATVIMPLSNVDYLPNFYYRFLAEPKKYKPFIIGGPDASQAAPITLAENSPQAQLQSEHGLVLAYNCGEIFVNRQRDCLWILNLKDDCQKSMDLFQESLKKWTFVA